MIPYHNLTHHTELWDGFEMFESRYGSKEGPDRPWNGSPTFYKLLEEMAETHDKKSHDYAANDNPSGNYHFAGKLALLFSHSEQDAGFIGRIGEKIYRLANLESSKKTPQNESIEDTERDICVITALWMADRRNRRMQKNPLTGELLDLITLMPDSQTDELLSYIHQLKLTRKMNKEGKELDKRNSKE